ncbi:MAG: CDP-alcohol phosphatidyltransferase family protein [Flavobacteriaceae bacterium]|nr:CDP-alcohol phosphatidyltransferase family protein [Flavobacteriaceae bacterium]
MKNHIPNIITLLNLLSGTIAVMLAVSDRLIEAALFVLIGIFFDFFDGLVARLLKVQSELGKELDSLADMVTSGVVPGIVMYQLLSKTSDNNWSVFEKENIVGWSNTNIDFLPFIGLLLTLAAAYRLAKFNLDERQTSFFIGLPTPAMALFILSLPVVLIYGEGELAKNLILNKYFLITITLVFSVLMNVEIYLFSLKFKNFSFKNNSIEISFVLVSVALIILLKISAIPILILLYILLSTLKNSTSKA